jgi:hypothetical protein
MLSMYVNGSFPKNDFQETIYRGTIWLNTKLDTAQKFCRFADHCAVEALGEDPRSAHKRMPVAEFVSKVGRLKSRFTNDELSKKYIREFLEEIDQDPKDYLFDVPRLRVVPNYDYLHAGVSYAYKPHRDLWYGNPNCQINTWMTVYPIDPSQTMMINPAYFARKIKNSSNVWDLKDWIENQRPRAIQNVTVEERPHPLPLEDIDDSGEIRVAGERAEMLIFSGAHLHGTVPNLGERVRFSIDFRVLNKADLRAGRGATNVDSEAHNVEYGYKDLFNAADLTPYTEMT